jgi:hypothetical protein
MLEAQLVCDAAENLVIVWEVFEKCKKFASADRQQFTKIQRANTSIFVLPSKERKNAYRLSLHQLLQCLVPAFTC